MKRWRLWQVACFVSGWLLIETGRPVGWILGVVALVFAVDVAAWRRDRRRRPEPQPTEEQWGRAERHYRRHVARLRDEPNCQRCGRELRLDFVHGVPVYQCSKHGAGWRSPTTTRRG